MRHVDDEMPRGKRPVQWRCFNDVVGYADKDDMSLDQLILLMSLRGIDLDINTSLAMLGNNIDIYLCRRFGR